MNAKMMNFFLLDGRKVRKPVTIWPQFWYFYQPLWQSLMITPFIIRTSSRRNYCVGCLYFNDTATSSEHAGKRVLWKI